MISFSFSTTTKSRTFSDNSASVRGSSVPSGEYSPMSLWICSTSGRMALRVSMECLLERANALFEIFKSRSHLCGSGTAWNIMTTKDSFQRDRGIKIAVKRRIELLQILQTQISQLTATIEAEAHGLAAALVGCAEGNALRCKICCSGHSIHKATLGSSAHASEVEVAVAQEADRSLYALQRCIGRIEHRLLRLLQIFVVGKRQASYGHQQ